MAMRNSTTSWGWLSRWLHWAMAFLILGMLIFGLYLTTAFNDGDPSKLGLVQTHKSFGFLVFALACLRIIWRAVNPTPALPATMPALLKLGAKAGHWAIYLLMFAMPVSGWLGASASPYNDVDSYPMQIKNMVFGLFELPDPYPVGSYDVSDMFMAVHKWAAIALALILAGHVAAAIKHAVVDRDGVMSRMWTG